MQTSTNTKLKIDAPARDVAGLAEDRRRRGLALALRMFKAGERRSSKRARLRAVLIGRCSDPDNLWTAEGLPGCATCKARARGMTAEQMKAEGLPDCDGCEFGAVGVKSACASRLCPHCIKLIQSRAQKRLVAARDEFWKDCATERGKCERFITLTSPTLAGVSLYETEKIYNRAWAALTHTDFWKDRVEGGAKHLEFTVNAKGYHTHLHVMTYGSYIERDIEQQAGTVKYRDGRAERMRARGLSVVDEELPTLGNLQDEWTKCITAAARYFGHVIEWGAAENARPRRVDTEDGKVIECHPTTAQKAGVDVRLVREKGQAGPGEKGIASAVKELTKYITKASSWEAVSEDQLVEIAEVKRWRRCFELFGSWREAGQRLKGKPPPRAPFVELNDGETWQQFYRRATEAGASDDCFVLALATIERREAVAARSAAAAEGGEDAYLDTDCINRIGEGCEGRARDEDRGPPRAGPSLPVVIRLWFDVLFRAWPSEGLHVWAACVVLLFIYEPTRALPLMEIGEAIEFETWLVLVGFRLVRARRARMHQLSKLYPGQVFKCLDGSEFYGDEWRKARHKGEGRLRQSAEWSAFVSESRERNRAAFGELVARSENHDWWKWVNEPAGDDDWKREIRKMVWDRFKASKVET